MPVGRVEAFDPMRFTLRRVLLQEVKRTVVTILLVTIHGRYASPDTHGRSIAGLWSLSGLW